tara:strand:- start:6675 stop:7427 length:753 start_codon:yes stop_codon:yes gene_type:complete
MLTDYFHKNFYSDLPIEDVHNAIHTNDESYNKAVDFIHKKHYSDLDPKDIKNNLFNRTFRDNRLMKQEILNENPALKDVMSLDNMNINFAKGNQQRLLEEAGHNPEYFDKDNNKNGILDNQNDIDSGLPYYGDITLENGIIKNPNSGEFTTLINKKGLNRAQIKDIATNDFISHSLHYSPKYEEYSKMLGQELLKKYSPEMIEKNGGVDAYIRGIISNDEAYKPYRDEMNHIEPSLINNIKSYIKEGSKK